MGDIFSTDYTLQVLGKSLEGLSRRHKVLANNIANVDTPDFKRSDVNFQDTLKGIIEGEEGKEEKLPLSTTNPKHINSTLKGDDSSFFIVRDMTTSQRKDGNNVDMEKEIAELNKNSLLYNSTVNLLNTKFSLLRFAVDEGRR